MSFATSKMVKTTLQTLKVNRMGMATQSGSMEFRTLVSKLRYTEEYSPQSGTLQSRTQTLEVACSLYLLLYT